MMWTSEQEKALQIKDKNILVSAAAGSGKTAVLVERIINIITDVNNPTDINEILVVTFTKAAANEMKERVIRALLNKIDELPDSIHLQRQLILLSQALITTIHAFCLEVMRSNYNFIELSPNFRVANEEEISLILIDTVNKVLEVEYETSENVFFDKLVNSYTNGRDDKELQDIIISMYDKIRQISVEPINWLENAVDTYKMGKDEKIDENMWIRLIKIQIHIEIQDIIKDVKGVLEELRKHDIREYIELISEEHDLFDELKMTLVKGIEYFYNRLLEVGFDRLPAIKDKIDETIKMKVQNVREVMKSFVKNTKEKVFILSPHEMIERMEEWHPILYKLVDIIKKVDEKFLSVKKEKGIVDYSDIEHYTLNVLRDKSDLEKVVASSRAIKLQEKYKYIFIDEYQDINIIQDTILTLVSKESANYSNVFMVGDVKQSIYKFRQAKPEIFLQKYHEFSKGQDKLNTAVDFTQNFRSRDTIISFVNFIFKRLMTYEMSGINYDERAELNLGAEYENTNKYIANQIDLDVIDKKDEESTDDEVEEMSKADIEAKHVINKIRKMIEDELHIYDKKLSQYRQVQYRDIVILLRSTKNYVEEYIDIFRKSGIPLYSEDDKGYFDSIEIRLILNILRVVDNPMYDIPTIALLKSPIFGFTLDELVMIRNSNKQGCFYDALKSLVNIKLKQKIDGFFEVILRWRAYSECMTIRELLEKIYKETNIYEIEYCSKTVKLKNANLRLLIKKAEQYEKTTFSGVFDFIRFIDKVIESNKDVSSAKVIGENEDVVRIMTIHKSKGLEFPVVFLCGTTKKLNTATSLKDGVLIHDKYGVGTDLVDLTNNIIYKTFPKYIIEKQIRKEIISEEIRVLYVALTRAKEKMIIVSVTNDYEKEKGKILEKSDMQMGTLSDRYILGCQNYFQMIGACTLMEGQREELKDKLNINVLNKQDVILGFIEGETEGKEETMEEVKPEKFWMYKYEDVNKYHRKLSVTDLKKEVGVVGKRYESKLLKISPRTVNKEYNNTQKGIIVHKVLKHLDYKKVLSIAGLDDELNSLINNNIVSNEDIKNIEKHVIYKFLLSHLANRMRKAGKLYRETPFVLEKSINDLYNEEADEKVFIQGIIDCYFEEDGEIVLVDYKSDYTDDDTGECIKEKYTEQLNIYEEALRGILGKNVKEKIIYSLHLNKQLLLK
ncbi:MAG TPA: helicase-exonuclease AddAB subunit AddA [Clostridiales bacterium]|nr:MAG: helicase-exonuclease AddAB subunit AddA [Clostridiales bacterium GWD2_32_19]HCC06956.1 helicase-exonuclease AddAB subunit AddA [Clostridiales bacterium]